MSTVVNSQAFSDVFTKLGWVNNQSDLLSAALSAGLPAEVILAYLDALAASPTGLNDQTITGVTAAQGTAITTFLKARALVGV